MTNNAILLTMQLFTNSAAALPCEMAADGTPIYQEKASFGSFVTKQQKAWAKRQAGTEERSRQKRAQ